MYNYNLTFPHRRCCPNLKCNRACGSRVMHELFPFIRIMRRYSIRKNLLQDVVAGLTVGIMHIPQGAYCQKIIIL